MAAFDYRQSCCGRYVMLPGGLALPIEPILLALELERRGVKLWRDGDDIVIEPFSLLSDDDKTQLKFWKRHVLALLDYRPESVQ